jgi:hypothetical protein
MAPGSDNPTEGGMGNKAFEASLGEGVHHRLAPMAGEWEGEFRIWFEPGQPAQVSRQRGRVRAVLGGRFLLHEYTGSCAGEPLEGVALWGYHLDERRFEVAWAESFGTGTALMWCTGTPDDARLAVLGSYGDGQGGPRWGWRTLIEQPDLEHLNITMFNITPDGQEFKAVEVLYLRQPGA